MAIIKVTDTGIGLSPQMLAHIFEPFSQADSSLDRSRGGLGLGLALVKGLVELHGGEVSAASEGEGRGAEFTIRLQLAESDEPVPQAGAVDHGSRSHLRILIIDDQRDASLPMKTLLELDGHEVEVATTGRQGIETAQVWCPHVVLCDIGLPEGMSGYVVAAELRNREQTRDAILVAVTGYGQEEDRRQALQAGFDRHMTKPVGQAELRELLASLEPVQRI
jgi:CheY-like chemotaxis protein